MKLEKKDSVVIICILVVLLFISIAGWLLVREATLVIVIPIGIVLIIACNLVLYRNMLNIQHLQQNEHREVIRELDVRLPVESLLLEDKINIITNKQSLIFFTVHKCASAYVDRILKRLTKDFLRPVDFEAFFWAHKPSALKYDLEKYLHWKADNPKEAIKQSADDVDGLFEHKGYCYGAFRKLIGVIPNLEMYKIILMLRDPRDILVSLYYSLRYSHEIPSGNPYTTKLMCEARQKVCEMTIDDYVLDEAHVFMNRYLEYCGVLMGKSNVLFLKYEDMIQDFPVWLNSIVSFLGFDIKKDVLDAIISEADFQVKEEDVYSHKRQVTPGDHMRKLRPATIEQLNHDLKSVLDMLGYPQP